MIRDWNRSQVLGQAVFHFKNSLRPFVSITVSNEDIFLDIDSMEGYTLDELEYEGLEFYEKDDDGAEILFVDKKEWASYNRQGELIARHRTERVKHVDDDLPKISKEYKKFLEEKA